MGICSGSVVKNLPANTGDAGSTLGLEKSPGVGDGNPPVFLPGKVPWTEEPGGPLSMRSQRERHDLVTKQ